MGCRAHILERSHNFGAVAMRILTRYVPQPRSAEANALRLLAAEGEVCPMHHYYRPCTCTTDNMTICCNSLNHGISSFSLVLQSGQYRQYDLKVWMGHLTTNDYNFLDSIAVRLLCRQEKMLPPISADCHRLLWRLRTIARVIQCKQVHSGLDAHILLPRPSSGRVVPIQHAVTLAAPASWLHFRLRHSSEVTPGAGS